MKMCKFGHWHIIYFNHPVYTTCHDLNYFSLTPKRVGGPTQKFLFEFPIEVFFFFSGISSSFPSSLFPFLHITITGRFCWYDISWWEQVTFQWDDDDVCFVLDQLVGSLQCYIHCVSTVYFNNMTFIVGQGIVFRDI
jgi:hypothetical protein